MAPWDAVCVLPVLWLQLPNESAGETLHFIRRFLRLFSKERKEMDIFKEFATDEKLETEGRWISLGKGARIKVARDNNEKFVKLMRELLEEHRITLEEGNEAADELARDIVRRAKAKAVLVDFEGITYKGKKMEYSEDNAFKLLGIKDFRRLVDEYSQEFSAYKIKSEEDSGND